MTGLELAAVQRDDALLDRIGAGQPVRADDPVTSLLVEWCTDVRSEVAPSALHEVEPAPIASMRRRSVRPVVVGVILMGVVGAGGVAAAATQAGPQSVLWPVAQLVAPAHAHSLQARDDVRSSLRRAHRQAMAGDRTGALATLRAATSRLSEVRAEDGAHRLWAQVRQMQTALAHSAAQSPAASDSAAPVAPVPTSSITPS
ncbi:MAG: anti-sigma-D factor RsdA, partial [Actinomycetota bacterium]|nr:anti-sigma-D factor RsdA [Actinomycetota bacterium]